MNTAAIRSAPGFVMLAINAAVLLPLAGAVAQESTTPPAQVQAEGEAKVQAKGDEKGEEKVEEKAPTVATQTESTATDSSPFEYEATEQISEDLSVSFPVDI